jgi:hypothetical protein
MDDDDFLKECQLIIAKHAFPNATGQNWGQVTWVGTAANSIRACLHKRMDGMKRKIEKDISQEMRAKLKEELEGIRQQASASAKQLAEAESKLSVSSKELQDAQLELQVVHRDFDDLHREFVAAKASARPATGPLRLITLASLTAAGGVRACVRLESRSPRAARACGGASCTEARG